MSHGPYPLGWRDMRNHFTTRDVGVTVPDFEQMGTTPFYAYAFIGTGVQPKTGLVEFHFDHDYALGTDVHFHIHWISGDATTGNVKWSLNLAYAKGHDQANFNFATPKTTTVIDAAPGSQYRHMITEVVISDDGTSLIDRSTFEEDGVLFVNFTRDPSDASDTYTGTAYVFEVDCHYQTNKPSTVNKAPPFS